MQICCLCTTNLKVESYVLYAKLVCPHVRTEVSLSLLDFTTLYYSIPINKRLYFCTLCNALGITKGEINAVAQKLKLLTVVTVISSGTSTYLSCLFSLLRRLEIKVHPGISAKFSKGRTKLFGYVASS